MAQQNPEILMIDDQNNTAFLTVSIQLSLHWTGKREPHHSSPLIYAQHTDAVNQSLL